MASWLPSTPAILRVEIIQGVAVLGENDDLPQAPTASRMFGIVLEDVREVHPTCDPGPKRRARLSLFLQA